MIDGEIIDGEMIDLFGGAGGNSDTDFVIAIEDRRGDNRLFLRALRKTLRALRL
jgi:hypothetical protein